MGILGCGQVAREYAATIRTSDIAALAACADARPAAATAFARQHAVRELTVEQLLDPAATDITVILTPPQTHAELARQAIAAGVPGIYVEKPLAGSYEEACALLAAAEAAGTLLGAAPDTVLGSPARTAKAAIVSGLIGEVRSANAAYLTAGPERWHPAPEPFYATGVGPLVDMGPYYLTMLTRLLGPFAAVTGASAATRPRRIIGTGPRAGAAFTAGAPTHVTALLRSAGEVPVTFVASFDSAGSKSPHLEIHGAGGTLLLPDPNFHDGEVLLRAADTCEWTALPQDSNTFAWTAARGVGVLELATLLTGEQSDHICSGRAAAHITGVIDAISRTAAESETEIPGQAPADPAPSG